MGGERLARFGEVFFVCEREGEGEKDLPGYAESKGILHREEIGEYAHLCCCGCDHDQ